MSFLSRRFGFAAYEVRQGMGYRGFIGLWAAHPLLIRHLSDYSSLMTDLHGKIALITASARGSGHAIALRNAPWNETNT